MKEKSKASVWEAIVISIKRSLIIFTNLPGIVHFIQESSFGKMFYSQKLTLVINKTLKKPVMED